MCYPRDPFHRVDARRSSRHVVLDGRRYGDAVRCYREPLLQALPAASHGSFHGEGVEVHVRA
jgi:uncharacterized protein (DUF427 family)